MTARKCADYIEIMIRKWAPRTTEQRLEELRQKITTTELETAAEMNNRCREKPDHRSKNNKCYIQTVTKLEVSTAVNNPEEDKEKWVRILGFSGALPEGALDDNIRSALQTRYTLGSCRRYSNCRDCTLTLFVILVRVIIGDSRHLLSRI